MTSLRIDQGGLVAAVMRWSIGAAFALAVITAVGCSRSAAPAQDVPPSTRVLLRVLNSEGQAFDLSVEVADTREEGERGLSGRSSLGADEGMLFVYDERPVGFWMKDTLIPLSAGFISGCGEFLAIVDMAPLSLEIHNPAVPYHFGLEVNQGWFSRHAVRPGSRIEVPASYRDPSCG